MVKIGRLIDQVDTVETVKQHGRVTKVVGLLIESLGPSVSVGEICRIYHRGSRYPVEAEVIGFREEKVLLMPLGSMEGLAPGAEVVATGNPLLIPVDERLLGRILDGLGRPIDGKGPILDPEALYPVEADPPNPLGRPRIREPLPVGIRAMDGVLTLGKGQRVGIFSGSGVGKSTLLGMMARNTTAEINVIGLVGERGREVREFMERDLGEDGLRRSVVVVATGDKPALIRFKGALVATTIAEYFRDRGHDVMLMMDSVTRFARAQREIGLAAGEPPATRGYTPSVFALLPKLLERAGTSDRGSITGLYTVLVEANDMEEPIADTVRGTLDGHIVLSREMAARNHYPSIDILESISRCMVDVVSQEHEDIARKIKTVMAVYRTAEDLINIGAYAKGSNPEIDYAVAHFQKINTFLQQGIFEKVTYEMTLEDMSCLFEEEE